MGDYRTENDGILPTGAVVRRRRKRRLLIGLLTGCGVVLAAALIVRVEGSVSALGFVTSEEHAEVRAPAAGTVAAILVRTGDMVQADELLVELDRREEDAVLAEARSRYRKAEAELELRRAQVAEAGRVRSDEIRLSVLRFEHAVERLDRMRELSSRGLVAGASLADAEHQVRLLSVELEKLQSRDEELADKEIQVLEREVEARREAVAMAAVRLRGREIRAPIAGQVLRYAFVVGEMVRPESVLMEIFGGDRQVLKLRISERHAMRVQPGDRYEARLGAYRGSRGVVFNGQVEFLRNVIQDDDRNPYRAAFCSFEPDGFAVPPGTSAEARIFTGRLPLWRWMTGWD